jgi:hypothetical protein
MTIIKFASLALILTLVACQKTPLPPEPVEKPQAKVQTGSRTEPVFYNGRQYQVSYNHDAARGDFDVRVKGLGKPMDAGDGARAQDIASGVLRHFACPKGLTGRIAGTPAYEAGTWRMTARCGR